MVRRVPAGILRWVAASTCSRRHVSIRLHLDRSRHDHGLRRHHLPADDDRRHKDDGPSDHENEHIADEPSHGALQSRRRFVPVESNGRSHQEVIPLLWYTELLLSIPTGQSSFVFPRARPIPQGPRYATLALKTAARGIILSCLAIWTGCTHQPSKSDTGTTPVVANDRRRALDMPASRLSSSRPMQPIQDSATDLAVIPGLEQTLLPSSLAPTAAKLDARGDEWDVEVFSSEAQSKLELLGEVIEQHSEIRAESLDHLFTDKVETTALRPTTLHEVFTDHGVTVHRLGKIEMPSQSRNRKDLPAFIAALTEPFGPGTHIRVKLKIIRVHLAETSVDTTVAYQASAQGDQHAVQQSAQWTCHWFHDSSDDTHRIGSICVDTFEEIATHSNTNQLLADCTEAVIGGTDSFQKQLSLGVDHWRRSLEKTLDPDLSGFQGVSLGDVNGDGLEDVYICQQGGLPNRLFIQRPDGTLKDVSQHAGVDYLELTSSALLIDLDNDGDQDLVLASQTNVVFLSNDGSGRFRRSALLIAKAALQSLAAADFDLDGDLDVYACGYSAGGPVWSGDASLGAPVPYYDANNGGPNMLMRNDGELRFSDVTSEVGLDANNRRFSFAATWEDYDNDGDSDLYVANDFGRNNLYRNENGHFVDIAEQAGVQDMATGMSACWGDYNNDGLMDLYVANMFSSAGGRIAYQRKFLPVADERTRSHVQRFARGNSLFQNVGNGEFTDASVASGVTNGRWAWASKFVDLNSDGFEDLLVANGFITHADTSDL